MLRLLIWALLSLLPLVMIACASLGTPAQLPPQSPPCTSRPARAQLFDGSWLRQPGIWQLRQSALLEIGRRKFPLEGLLQLDVGRGEARLAAMNEVGLVMFDLQLDTKGEQLQRVIPQLRQQPGFAPGVAESLRRIFLQPQPLAGDRLQLQPSSQRLWRPLPGGSLGFVFDCDAQLVEAREVSDAGDWRVNYNDYQKFDGVRIPQQIIFNDYRHKVKLSLWLREVKRKDE